MIPIGRSKKTSMCTHMHSTWTKKKMKAVKRRKRGAEERKQKKKDNASKALVLLMQQMCVMASRGLSLSDALCTTLHRYRIYSYAHTENGEKT